MRKLALHITAAIAVVSLSGASGCPRDNAAPESREIVLGNAGMVARLTGKPLRGDTIPSPNRTDSLYDVGGTDLGIIWDMGGGRVGIAFGDTYGKEFTPRPGGGPTGGPAGIETAPAPGNWRSNVVAFSDDRYPGDGITIGGMAADGAGNAREVIPSAHDKSGNGDFTTIPTAAVRVNGTDYIHYMSIRKWGTPKGWDTNFSSLYASRDDGQTWERCEEVVFGPESNFAQVCYAPKDGFVYMIGTMSGRQGAAWLARFPEESILDLGQYEYWNAASGWVKGDEDASTVLFDAPVGELSLMYQTKYKRWIAAYFNPGKYAIVYRDAAEITGPWSEEKVLVSGNEYPQLYGSYFHPLASDGDKVYFLVSFWRPYNVFLMSAEINVKPQD